MTSATYWNRLKELTLSEWKLREQSSLTGFLWTLLNPVMSFATLYWIFTQWLHGSVPNYASYLIIGVVQFGFFNGASTYAMTSLLRRRGIIMNFVLPRELVVFSSVLSMALSFLIEFALMLVFLVLLGARPTLAWAALPLLLALNVALMLGLGLALSVLAARFPDFERIWNIVITVGFFVTPVFYTLDSLSPERRRFIRFNPVAHLIEATRACLLGGRILDLRHWALLAGASAVVLAAGWAFFKTQERRISDYILS